MTQIDINVQKKTRWPKMKILEGQMSYRRWVVPKVPAFTLRSADRACHNGRLCGQGQGGRHDVQFTAGVRVGGGLITNLYSACSHEHTTATRVVVGWSMCGTEQNIPHMYPVYVNIFLLRFLSRAHI